MNDGGLVSIYFEALNLTGKTVTKITLNVSTFTAARDPSVNSTGTNDFSIVYVFDSPKGPNEKLFFFNAFMYAQNKDTKCLKITRVTLTFDDKTTETDSSYQFVFVNP